MRSNDRGNEIALALAVGKQRWKVEGQVGQGAILLEGKEDWPFDLRLASDGATVAAKGAMGTGERAGTVVADVSAELATAAALAPLGSDAAMSAAAARPARARALRGARAACRSAARVDRRTDHRRPDDSEHRAAAAPSRRGADIETDRLDEVRGRRVDDQAWRARAGGPEGAWAAVRRHPAAVRRRSRCRPPRRAHDGGPATSRDAVAVRRARPALIDLRSGRARRRRVRGRWRTGPQPGEPRARRGRAAARRCVLRCEVALRRGARCRHGRWRPLSWGPGQSLREPGHGRRNAEAACRVCERQRAAHGLRRDARGWHGRGARSQHPHDDAQSADSEGIRRSGAGGAMRGGAPAAAPRRRAPSIARSRPRPGKWRSWQAA